YEKQLRQAADRHEHFIFLNGFSSDAADALYNHGDLFMMPSSYEPCGISQMLAMRAGQPCLVHAVGGLRDTVRDGVTGFAFAGQTIGEQLDACGRRFADALTLALEQPEQYEAICK